MAVESTTSQASYAGNGSTKTFAVPFYFLADTHLVVQVVANGAITTLTLNSDYTVSGAGNASGGSVTLATAYSSAYTIVVSRVVPLTQETQYQQNSAFPAKTQEKSLDRLTMIGQQHQRTLGKALQFPDADVSGASPMLPLASVRATKPLIHDSSGNVTVGVEAYQEPSSLLSSADTAAATRDAAVLVQAAADNARYKQLAEAAAAAAALSVAQLNAGTGEQTVISAASVLRLMEPTIPYQRVTLRSGTLNESTSIRMGGTFYYDPSQTAADSTGFVVRTKVGNKAWVRVVESGYMHLNMFWEETDVSSVESFERWDKSAFTSGVANRSLAICLPSGGLYFHRPFVALPNQQLHYWGCGGEDAATRIYPSWDPAVNDYSDYGLFHQVNTSAGQAGASFHNVHFGGDLSIPCHGMYRVLSGHFVDDNVQVVQFNGAGAVHLGCQDMSSNIEIQGCGRTSGTRTAVADVSDTTKTTFAALEIGNAAGNAPNYCRYSGKQYEANQVSPYVRVNGTGGYGNVFRDIHVEQRQNIKGFDSNDYGWATAFLINGGEWVIDHIGVVQLNTTLNLGSYTVAHLCNIQRGTSIVSSGNNTTGTLSITNCTLGALTMGARAGWLKIDNSYFNGAVSLSYVVYALGFSITNTTFTSTFSMTNEGGSSFTKYIENCQFSGDFIVNSVNFVSVKHCNIAGDATFASSKGEWIRNRVIGAENVTKAPLQKYEPWGIYESFDTAPPSGTFPAGSRVWNSAPALGGYVGWVFITGSGWKGFGLIASS